MAAAGATLPEITSAIAGEYSIPEAQANADALRLVNQFIEEQLLFPHTYSTVPQPPAADMPPTPYTTPQLEIYREIGHLLALDPPMPGMENISWDEPRPTR